MTSPSQTTEVLLPSQIIITSQLDKLMQYYNLLHKKTKIELAVEYEMAKQSFIHEKSDGNRIRYILLLLFPKTSFYDNDTALSLLEEWPQSKQQLSDLEGFKSLLFILLTEQQGMEKTIRNLSHQISLEKERASSLQKKVDDIKVMEKNLLRRNTL